MTEDEKKIGRAAAVKAMRKLSDDYRITRAAESACWTRRWWLT